MAATWVTCAVSLAVVAGLAGAGGAGIGSVVGGLGFVVALALAWRASHMRIELGDDALVAHGALRTVHIPRVEIAGVGIAPLGNGLRGVAITHRDGRVLRLDAIASFRRYDEAELAAGAVQAWVGHPGPPVVAEHLA